MPRPKRSRRTRSGSAPAPDSAQTQQLVRTVHELRVHQEELVTQNELLRETHAALEQSRERYVDLFESAPVAYLATDFAGLIREINLAGERLLEVGRRHLVGAPFVVRVADADQRRFLDLFHRCRGAGEVVTAELGIRGRRHRVVPVGAVMNCTETGIRFVLHDLSERDRIASEDAHLAVERRRLDQREALIAAANEAKDHFLAMLSHELRTPLVPVLAAVDAIESEQRLSPRALELLELVRRNTKVEARLIDDLLDVSRIQHGKLPVTMRQVDVHEVVRDVIDNVAAEGPRRHDVVVALHATAHHVRGDPVRLQQLVSNLLANARRHTPAGGRIAVRTENFAASRIRLVVEDTGTGMDAEALSSLFVPFMPGRDDASGASPASARLGLGLAISRGIAEAHGGSIEARSEGSGLGSTFVVELPAMEPAQLLQEPPTAVKAPAASASRPLRILLVEDHADSALALAMVLRLHGHTVAVARTVAEALEAARAPHDALVSDLDLPDGTGFDLIARLPAERRLPAVALSGHGGRDVREQCRLAGFQEHLIKPVELTTLLAAVARAVDAASSNGTSRAAGR